MRELLVFEQGGKFAFNQTKVELKSRPVPAS